MADKKQGGHHQGWRNTRDGTPPRTRDQLEDRVVLVKRDRRQPQHRHIKGTHGERRKADGDDLDQRTNANQAMAMGG